MHRFKSWFTGSSKRKKIITAILFMFVLGGGAALAFETALVANHSRPTAKSTPMSQKTAPNHSVTAEAPSLPEAPSDSQDADSSATGATPPVAAQTRSQAPVQQYSQSTTSQAIYAPPAQPECTDSESSSLAALYNSYVNAENSRHINAVNDIDNSWNAKGMYYSGGHQAAIDNENQQHQAKIQQLDVQNQQRLSEAGC